MKISKLLVGLLFYAVCGQAHAQEWNNPYPNEDPKSITLYSAFSERPKHLDPAVSYTVSEAAIISQIYEPPLQYHYLKRPYVLEPLTGAALPEVHYFNDKDQELAIDASKEKVAYTEYRIRIKPGIYYQSHPAFAKDASGNYRYHHLSAKEVNRYRTLADFKETATRECIAEDFVYEIKRLAEPSLNSPIYGLMSEYILGLKELRQALVQAKSEFGLGLERDLRPYDLLGAKVVDRYEYRIRIRGKYPQFKFWLAMNFFAPIPWEAAVFYAQPGLHQHNISMDWYPVGTGPFQLSENNPERRMVLIRNANFREEYFPSEGTEQDKNLGLLENAGEKLPLLDRVVYSLERESIPFWNKFLQGYYDISAIASDNFSSAIRLNSEGKLVVTEVLQEKGIHLNASVSPNVFYWGFNMLDKTVGGDSLQAKKLRQAINLAFDVDEFISIFLNGRGVLAKGPIPPDIFGYETQLSASENERLKELNKNTHHENNNNSSNNNSSSNSKNNNKNKNKNKNNLNHSKTLRAEAIVKAKQLLKEAGYAKGLTLYLDVPATGDPDEIATHVWLKEQFTKIGLQLVIRGTQYNRFQDKILHGDTQLYFLGWTADYPDPENFLFLMYGPNAAAQFGGENKSNYSNPEYDKLFEKMRLLPDGAERLAVISQMVKILQEDNPWIWGFFPKSFGLYQGWCRVTKPSTIVHNTLKYFNVNPALREKSRIAWNQPLLWPLFVSLIILVVSLLFIFIFYRRKQMKPRMRK